MLKYLFAPLLISVSYLTKFPKPFYLYLRQKYKKWNRLKLLVKTTETNTFRIYYVSCKLVASLTYNNFIQMVTNKNVTLVEKNIYKVDYILNGKNYSMLVSPKRGPRPVLSIKNQKGECITEQVLPFMGPKYDWHGHIPNASLFGCTKIILENSDGTETEII